MAKGEASPRVITLKCHPEAFVLVRNRVKMYEIRKDDRGYAVGDVLVLQEWEPTTERYTGEMESRRVICKTPGGHWGLPDDVCVLGIEPLAGESEPAVSAKRLRDAHKLLMDRVHILGRSGAFEAANEVELCANGIQQLIAECEGGNVDE